MKKYLPIILGVFLLLMARADSQTEAEAEASVDQVAALKAIQQDNNALLDRQSKTLQKLDELIETSQQIKIFSKRT